MSLIRVCNFMAIYGVIHEEENDLASCVFIFVFTTAFGVPLLSSNFISFINWNVHNK